MEYRLLGRTGLRVSVYGLGTNAFGSRADASTATRIIHHALDQGVNLIDTANTYNEGESERIIGSTVRDRRDQVILASKCGMAVGDGPNDRGSSRAHIMREVEGSLRRLGTDWIDLYQIHEFDPDTPLEETLRALDDLVRQGKVRYVGCSNYAAWQLAKALGISERLHLTRYVSIQPPYSPADRGIERELVPLCLDQGVGILTYFPLAGGILTGKYRPEGPPPPGSRAVTQPRFAQRLTERNLRLAEGIAAIAARLGITPAQLALAWALHKPGITSVLVGATRVEQQAENLQAVQVTLAAETVQEIDELSADFV